MAERKKDPAKVQLKNVRLSFAAIYKAKGFGGGRGDDNGEPKFSANFLIDPETREGKVNIGKMEDAIDYAISNHKWEGKTPKFPEAKLPLRDGDNSDRDEYEGVMFVSASNAKRPRVLDADKLDVSEGDDGAPYSGCYVDAIVRVWAQDNKFGKRINASLEGIRFRDDGDAFGAAPLDPDEFDDDEDDRSSRRSSSRGRDKDDDEDRGSRRSSGRSRDKDDDEDDRGSRRSSGRSRDKDDEDDRGSHRSSSRGRDKDEDEDDKGSRRSSSRGRDKDDDEDDRGSRRSSGRSRDKDDDEDDRGSRRRSSRDKDDDDDKGSRRRSSRDDDDDDGERRSSRGSRRRNRDEDDLT